ncbi:hypothetical protein CXT76_01195 [Candidatus Parvarchaeota archaeon]|jgi:hypothetical protein|nr:MAG: hypothetical protein CXT76_01195 [Candidatus Parvarchaeota archaeon]HIG51864.1 hypothetical protein [Candidatus Pacearchaeota archaeon]
MLNKKEGAFELSVGTIVVLVIAMSMLILGLVLVRTIFTGSTESVDALNDKVKNEITSLFAQEDKNVIVMLGSGNTLKIKPGEPIGVGIGARHPDGSEITSRSDLTYSLSQGTGNCADTERFFITEFKKSTSFDEFDQSSLFSIIQVRVPEGTAVCNQKILIDVSDSNGEIIGGSFFNIEVGKSGFF